MERNCTRCDKALTVGTFNGRRIELSIDPAEKGNLKVLGWSEVGPIVAYTDGDGPYRGHFSVCAGRRPDPAGDRNFIDRSTGVVDNYRIEEMPGASQKILRSTWQ